MRSTNGHLPIKAFIFKNKLLVQGAFIVFFSYDVISSEIPTKRGTEWGDLAIRDAVTRFLDFARNDVLY